MVLQTLKIETLAKVVSTVEKHLVGRSAPGELEEALRELKMRMIENGASPRLVRTMDWSKLLTRFLAEEDG